MFTVTVYTDGWRASSSHVLFCNILAEAGLAPRKGTQPDRPRAQRVAGAVARSFCCSWSCASCCSLASRRAWLLATARSVTITRLPTPCAPPPGRGRCYEQELASVKPRQPSASSSAPRARDRARRRDRRSQRTHRHQARCRQRCNDAAKVLCVAAHPRSGGRCSGRAAELARVAVWRRCRRQCRFVTDGGQQ